MTDVNGRRRYDATGRRAQAVATRRSVLEAARVLLEHNGFAATSIAAVAARAGVSAETVYKAFGNKAALAKAVFDIVIAGDDDPVPVAERADARAIRAEPDVRAKLRLYAASAAVRQERSARVQLAIRDARHVDQAVADLWQTLNEERLAGMTMLARHLLETGGLRPGIEPDEVRDVLWTCVAVEQYDLLVLQRGWSRERYAGWVGAVLVATLVDGSG